MVRPPSASSMEAVADVSLAKEIENLRQESQALKMIRQSLGSKEFPRKVFEKVYKDDIDRLRSMEDMWKTREAPELLDFDQLSSETKSTNPALAQQDQAVWSTAENFAVFIDRHDTLSSSPEPL